jgi:hypothetical protein
MVFALVLLREYGLLLSLRLLLFSVFLCGVLVQMVCVVIAIISLCIVHLVQHHGARSKP